jgi:uncharacterized protein
MTRAITCAARQRDRRGQTRIGLLRGLALLALGLCFQVSSPATRSNGQDQRPLDLRSPVRDADHILFKQNWSWQEMRTRNIVMQRLDYSCGAAAMATVMRYGLGDDINEMAVLKALDQVLTQEELKERIKNGLTMSDLRRVAVKMGYAADVGKVKISDLSTSKVPLLVGIIDDGYDHFVVVRGVKCGWIFLADPMRGNIRYPVHVFQAKWQKNAVLVVLKPNQKPPEVTALTVRSNDVSLGWLNNEIIQKSPSRVNGLGSP